ncbi:hypothetical protein BS47DRAFT_1304407 [Hydnum rufescens UP504]|uniref:EXPERA domain-containing protein n=1 Tax=Hydnum rufescens UP504 TaxID=1448309 RepID=A0A9P6DQ86_9AGAM|nr:hypothetical protein BS47DRAFT_1304407 [Hydnum rufescens UP504]
MASTANRPLRLSPTPTWISLWFFLSSLFVLWDVSYLLLRPRSMVGGDLHWIWKPYALYATIDHVRLYGLRAWESKDGFPSAQALMNIVETALNWCYLFTRHISPSPISPLLGFTAAVMTLSKTVLYGLQDYFCGWCSSGHNPASTFIVLYLFPNVKCGPLMTPLLRLWVVMPAAIVVFLGRELASSLSVATEARRSKTV